jgi:hypothetical protein
MILKDVYYEFPFQSLAFFYMWVFEVVSVKVEYKEEPHDFGLIFG